MPCLLVSARQWSFSLSTDGRKMFLARLQTFLYMVYVGIKKNVSPRPYTLSAQPYDFEPHWLILNIFVAHFHFWQFHALVSRILLRSNCSKYLINGQSLYTRYCGKCGKVKCIFLQCSFNSHWDGSGLFFSKTVGHTDRTQTLVLFRTTNNLSSKSLIYGLSTF